LNPPTPSGRDASSEATAATSARRSQLSADWLVQAARLEAMLDPVDEPLLAAAALCPGEAVVDIGCGRGPTARRAAATVGALGRVMGVDVGEGVIDAARAIASVPEAAPLRWIAADAAALQLDEQVDVVTASLSSPGRRGSYQRSIVATSFRWLGAPVAVPSVHRRPVAT